MKKLVYTIALFGLVVLTACSGDSPTAQAVPTVVPQEWAITSLTASDTDPYIGIPILVTAVVTQNGVAAPNGTTVHFTVHSVTCYSGSGAICAGFGAGAGVAESAAVSTHDGVATVEFIALDAGRRTIRARVSNASSALDVYYRDPNVDEDLVIHLPLVPNVGSFDGGETVVLRGTGVRGPVAVTFDVLGVLYQATIDEVIDSVPLSGPGQITVTTPEITLADRTQPRTADVIVRRGVDTPSDQTITLPSAFTFIDVQTGGPPIVYGLDPNFGRSQGGESILFFGRNFVHGATSVRWFGDGFDVTTPVEQVSVAPDGLAMDVITPRFSLNELLNDLTASVEVMTPNGSFTLNNAFTIVADDPQPRISSISPIAGPLGGGTVVTIWGSGFSVPVQVAFGVLTATEVVVINDPSPGGIDQITCVSPDYSQQGQVPPVIVDVTVTNMQSNWPPPQNTSNAVQFHYGDNLFISGNSPTEGWPGDQVVIYGAGFEDPLQVFFGPDELDVQSVSGTEILVRFPTDLPVSCSDRTGTFRVRLIESNLEATGGTFILRGNQPTVIDVEPTFVQADETGNYVSPSDITISGADFADTLLVEINAFVMASSAVTVVNETTIEVTGIPAPNDFGLVFDTTPCLTDDGLQGLRKAPTPVNVSVVNLPGNCRSTLAGGLIYEPGDDTCVASATIEADPNPMVFAPAPAGSCSSADLTISNGGAGTLEVFQMNLIGRFFFDSGATTQVAAGFQVPPLGSAAPVPIYFCPDVDGGAVYSGQVAIQNSSPANPFYVDLSATEAFPDWQVNATSFDFGDQTAGGGQVSLPNALTITNLGAAALTWTLTISGADPANFWILEGATGTVPPISFVDYTLIFNPTGVRAFSATLTITADQPDATPVSVDITVTGNGI